MAGFAKSLKKGDQFKVRSKPSPCPSAYRPVWEQVPRWLAATKWMSCPASTR
ncbi:MAG: hypothetical protein Ct9H300mP32_6950 [Verrucomicrobiota bacterium]|nr:MAG: hypothetical protein Ct9H300mP32_6950 [Verrucomicrobiota bacterium]